MATSDRILAYLGSTRNIAGSICGLAGVGLVFLGVAGSLWPVVVVGLYGLGALLAPSDKRRVVLSLATAETSALRAELDTLVGRLRGLPPDVIDRVVELAGTLRGVLGRVESPDHLHVVSQTIRDYLPTSLDAYGRLPQDRRRAAHDELLSQLDLLKAGLGRVADAVHAGDEQALKDQGRFLQDRFGGSSLDL